MFKKILWSIHVRTLAHWNDLLTHLSAASQPEYLRHPTGKFCGKINLLLMLLLCTIRMVIVYIIQIKYFMWICRWLNLTQFWLTLIFISVFVEGWNDFINMFSVLFLCLRKLHQIVGTQKNVTLKHTGIFSDRECLD